MKTVVRGTPDSIEVDGKTYPVRWHNNRSFRVPMNNARHPEYVESPNFAGLEERIRLWVTINKRDREIAKLRKQGQEVAPMILATDGVRVVQVRGRHASREGIMLITIPETGRKTEIDERRLLRTDTDMDHLGALNAKHSQLQTEMNELQHDFYQVYRSHENDTIDISYHPDTDDFYATLTTDGATFNAIGETSHDAEQQIEALVGAHALPWTISYDTKPPRVVRSLTDYRRSGTGYLTEEDAAHYLELSNQREAVVDEIKEYEEQFQFDYEAEVARVLGAKADA